MNTTAASAGLFGLIASFIGIYIGWYILTLVARWRVFTKAGFAGWKSLIPIYSDYVLFKISWKTSFFWAFLVLSFVCSYLGNQMTAYTDAGQSVPMLMSMASTVAGLLVAGINLLLNVNLSNRFGHSAMFGLGLTIFPPIFLMILGLGSSEYQGNPYENIPPRRSYYR